MLNVVLHQFDNAAFDGLAHRLLGIVHLQLPEDVLAVAIDGVEAEVLFVGYLLGAFSQGYLFKYSALAFGEGLRF